MLLRSAASVRGPSGTCARWWGGGAGREGQTGTAAAGTASVQLLLPLTS